jgi:hypothetical protein
MYVSSIFLSALLIIVLIPISLYDDHQLFGESIYYVSGKPTYGTYGTYGTFGTFGTLGNVTGNSTYGTFGTLGNVTGNISR